MLSASKLLIPDLRTALIYRKTSPPATAAVLFIVIDLWNSKQRAIPGLPPTDNLIMVDYAQTKGIALIILNTGKYL